MAGNYPTDVLPLPSQDGYSFSVESVVERVQMDSGRWRQVRTKTAQYHFITVSWEFTDSELELFKGFFNIVANYGADWFSMPLAFGNGCNINLAQFVGGYKASNKGILNWVVSAELQCEAITEIDNQTDLETAGGLIGLVGTAWVDVLPKPGVGYSFEVEPATIRTKSSGARYENRNRNKRAVHIVTVDWLLSDAQMEFFKGWHRVILELGCNKFDYDLAFGDGYKSNSARFVDGVFSASYVEGDNWRVSAQLEVDAVTDEIKTFAAYAAKLSNP